MVLELLEGRDVRALLKERKSFSVPEAVDILLQTAEGVADAHRLGVVHRDLKPSNLFAVAKRGGRHLIKVLDFGVSKTIRAELTDDAELTTTRTLVGSPSFMSPEQVRDPKSVDHRSDVWSLGVILHQLLSGQTPFRRDVPMELQAVVDRCLEKDPARRFQSMEELIAALTPFASEADASGRVSGEPPYGARPRTPSLPAPIPRPPRVSLAPPEDGLAATIAAAIGRELSKQGIGGEVRVSGDEVRLLGAASRIAAPLGMLLREWQSLAPDLRERRITSVAQRLAREYRAKTKLNRAPSPLGQAMMVLALLALAGLAVWAAWTLLGGAFAR
jgi:hypothetical protein